MLLWCVTADEPREATGTKEQGPQRQQELLLLEEDIRRMARGDKEALGRFYENTRTAVYGFALSILKHKSDAEDVLQEVYLNVYHAAGRYESRGNPMPWLLTIARNLALMRLRERSRQAEIGPEELEAELAAITAGPEVSHEDRMMLRAVLQSLSDEEMQIVMLHAAAGCRHREIAGMLELPLATELSKYHRALKKLKKKWEEGHES